MILTYPVVATQEVKQTCLDLVNKKASFTVTLVKDEQQKDHHWEIHTL